MGPRSTRNSRSHGKRKAEDAGSSGGRSGARGGGCSSRCRDSDATDALSATSSSPREALEPPSCSARGLAARAKLERIDLNTGRRKELRTPTAQTSVTLSRGAGSTASRTKGPTASISLPDNALAHIMFGGFLDTPTVVSRLSLVCQRVSRIGEEACKILDLHGKSVTPERVAALLVRYHHVEFLDLSFCRKLTGCAGLGPALQPAARTLQVLSLRGVGVDNEAVVALAKLEQLRRLDVSQALLGNADLVTDTGILALSHLKNLTHLSIAWNKNVTDEAVAAAVGRMPLLQFFDASLCQLVGSDTAKALNAACSDLREIAVTGCPKMDRACMQALVAKRGCRKLHTIQLAHCPRFTAVALMVLQDLPALRNLDLRHCDLLAVADVRTFRDARPEVSIDELWV